MEIEREQKLSFEEMKEVPPQFVRPVNERPENTKAVEGVSVPVISLSLPHHLLVKQITEAASEWGFFLITDHGISPTLIQRLQQDQKEALANDPSAASFQGYGTKFTKNLDQKLEWIHYFFHVMAPPSKVDYNMWPQNPPSYRQVTEEYNVELSRVRDMMLEILSEGLGVERNALKSSLGNEEMEMEMKINVYPPCPQPELALGVESHTDMSALTFLVPNEVPGLQIWKDNNWVAANYVENALFVHVGDQLEVLSNGKYKSVLHRSLVNKERTRISWAVFLVPPLETVIGPLPSLLTHQSPPKFSAKTYAEFRYRKLNKLPQ
ncbi:flavonol synthase/flavanone 3-hydroxylase-like [Senna tora]|uniref:Flavonol synthase/flavanone 3-hydroxylase-like n=1 Tax=Senna tora TaxID=362788 RepID=A0A834T878_9FABA|nr:flavonol synthase/flavanone 3-hydroxylase-like [Senna tora]